VTVFALLRGELPPRHLVGIDASSSVLEAQAAAQHAFREPGAMFRLSYGGNECADESAPLSSYNVPDEALIDAERVLGAGRHDRHGR
jgi:hypothetical protein